MHAPQSKLLDAIVVPMAVHIGPDLGVGLNAISNDLLTQVLPYADMQTGDVIQILLDDTEVARKEVRDEDLGNLVSLFIPRSDLANGWHDLSYSVSSFTGETTDATSVRLRVKSLLPGGPDPDPSTPQHEGLGLPQVPDDVLLNGVDAEWAASGVPVTLAPYTNMEAGDMIRLSWGGAFVMHTVTAEEAGQPLTLTVTSDVIEEAGDQEELLLMFEVADQCLNRSGWSPRQTLFVDAHGQHLEAPIIQGSELVDGTQVLDLDTLAGANATVTVLLTTDDFTQGDTVTLTWRGVQADGSVNEYNASLPVLQVPGTLDFSIPNDRVAALVDGFVVASYTRLSPQGTDVSRRTTAQVVGAVAELTAPSVREAEGGTLSPDLEQVHVDIAPYANMAEGDILTLIVIGTPISGAAETYSESININRSEVGETVTFTVSGAYLPWLENGSVELRYEVQPFTGGLLRSASLTLRVGGASLPAPSVEEASNGLLDPDDILDYAHVVVAPYPQMAFGDRVTLAWQGSAAQGSTSDEALIGTPSVGQPVTFRVDPAFVSANFDGTVDVSYSVTAANGESYGSSKKLHLIVQHGGSLLLPAPSVDEADNGTLDPEAVPDGAHLRVPAYPDMAEGDYVEVRWHPLGAGEDWADAINVTASMVGQSFSLLLPAETINAAKGQSVELSYTVSRFAGGEYPSEVATLTVSAPRPSLDAPVFDEAVNGTLYLANLPNGATAKVTPYPQMAVGDKVTLTWRTSQLEWSTEQSVLAPQVGQDLLINIPQSLLKASVDRLVGVSYAVARADGITDRSHTAWLRVEEHVNGTWQLLESMSEPRCLHTAQVMSDGEIIVIGGKSQTSISGDITEGDWSTTAEIYKDQSWSEAGSFGTNDHKKSTISAEGVLLATCITYNEPQFVIHWYYYNASDNKWNSNGYTATERPLHDFNLFPLPNSESDFIIDPFDNSRAFATNTQMTHASNTRLNSASAKLSIHRALTTGGIDSAETPSKEAYLLTFSNDSTPIESTRCSDMNLARANHQSIAFSDRYVLVMGGTDESGQISATCELYDFANDTWRTVGNMHSARRGFTATLLDNGMALVTGGVGMTAESEYQVLDSTELFDPITETWTRATNMTQARAYHTANKMPNGDVIVTGGVNNGLTATSTAEAFSLNIGEQTRPA